MECNSKLLDIKSKGLQTTFVGMIYIYINVLLIIHSLPVEQ